MPLRRPHTLLALAAFVLVGFLVGPDRARGTILRERRLHRGELAAEAPEGWGFSTQTGYPSIVFLLVHPDGSKLSLGRGQTKAPNGIAFADQNRAALRASKFRIETESEGARGTKTFDLRPEGGEQRVRQVYFVRAAKRRIATPNADAGTEGEPSRSAATTPDMNQGFVATLVTTEGLLSAHARDLVTFVESLAFDEDE